MTEISVVDRLVEFRAAVSDSEDPFDVHDRETARLAIAEIEKVDFQAIQEAISELRHEISIRDDVIAAYSTTIETQAATIDRYHRAEEGLSG